MAFDRSEDKENLNFEKYSMYLVLIVVISSKGDSKRGIKNQKWKGRKKGWTKHRTFPRGGLLETNNSFFQIKTDPRTRRIE